MSYQCHYIRANHKSEQPQAAVIFDNETWTQRYYLKNGQTVQRLRMGWAAFILWRGTYWEEEEPFFYTTNEELWDYLDDHFLGRERIRVWLVSHNLKFDWSINNLDSYFGRVGVWKKPDLEVIDRPCLYKVRSVDGGHGVLAMSTTNWYPEPLDEVSKAFGLGGKLAHPKDGGWDLWSDEEMKEYCLNDVVKLRSVFQLHVKNIVDNDWGMVRPTLAGQAWAMLFHRYIPSNQMFVFQEPRTLRLELDSFRGGRTECFRLGRFENAYGLDIKSQYPSVMLANPIPIKALFRSPQRLGEGADLPLDDSFVIARCKLDLKRPVISIRTPERLLSPIGHVRCAICSPEITAIIEHPEWGRIEEVEEYMAYAQAPIFKPFIEALYPLKENGEGVMRAFVKKAMNSSFGKFAQRDHIPAEDVTELAGADTIAEMMVADGVLRMDFVDGHTYTLKGSRLVRQAFGERGREGMSENAMPAVASAITAYARMKCWNEAIWPLYQKGLAFYTDTDSMWTDVRGMDLMVKSGVTDQFRLGAWAVEKGPCILDLFNLKYYYQDGVRKSKGVPKHAKMLEPHVFEYDQFQDGASRLRLGVDDGVPMKHITKTMSLEYKKGIVHPDGHIEPFAFQDW